MSKSIPVKREPYEGFEATHILPGVTINCFYYYEINVSDALLKRKLEYDDFTDPYLL